MPTMTFEGSWAYFKKSRGYLVGRTRRNLLQHLDFPAGKAVAARKRSPSDVRHLVVSGSALPFPSANRFEHTLNDQTGLHPFFEEVTRTISNGLDRGRNDIAATVGRWGT